MSPKFRGDSDEWLDDESGGGARRGARKPKQASSRHAGLLEPSAANATVSEVFPKLCRVRLDRASGSEGGGGQEVREVLCAYRRAGLATLGGRGDQRERAPVAVGDRVLARETGGGQGVIEGICARRNYLSRPAPGSSSQGAQQGAVTSDLQHVIAANIDVLLIVASVVRPEFSPGLVDRYLVAAALRGIKAHLCVTKVDLAGELQPWKIYSDLGIELSEVSVRSGEGLERLRSSLMGQRVVFCGHSGVGKTSLLSALLGTDAGRVGEVNRATEKGRHTTTSAVLLGGPGSSEWIDTPGVRAFGLTGVSPDALAGYFPEFAHLACTERGCDHLGVPDCMAEALPRYASYRRIHASLLAGEN